MPRPMPASGRPQLVPYQGTIGRCGRLSFPGDFNGQSSRPAAHAAAPSRAAGRPMVVGAYTAVRTRRNSDRLGPYESRPLRNETGRTIFNGTMLKHDKRKR